ncbi:prephenate dehydrogenase [Chloroflexota bacterium]
MKVAIIGGTGKMGLWFANFLLKDGKEVIIAGRNEKKLQGIKQRLGINVTSDISTAVSNADIILISVPIDKFDEVVKNIQPHLKPTHTVIDITSTKVAPVESMHKHIKTGLILGTHPVFGPGAKGIQNQNCVLTPTNDKEKELAQKIKHYLETRGAKVTLMTPQEHDEMMAVILGLAHFIAIVSAETLASFNKLKQMESIGGSTYKLLLMLAESVISEDADFYASLQMNLPKTTEVEALFQKHVKMWGDIVKNKDRQEFVTRMTSVRKIMEKNDPDFQKAYENMYKALGK